MIKKINMARRDISFLRMDSAENLMVINSVLLFEGAVDMPRLTSTIGERLINYPRFTQKVVIEKKRSYWQEDDTFNISKHLTLVESTGVICRKKLQDLVTKISAVPLDANLPLWNMTIFDKVSGGYAVLFRIQHCITDGLGLVHVLNHLTDDRQGDASTPSPHLCPNFAKSVNKRNVSLVGKCTYYSKVIMHLAALTCMFNDGKTRLKHSLSGNKKCIWLPPIEMESITAIAKKMQVTLNDIWVAAVAGALREYLIEQGEQMDEEMLRGAMTFNLREKANAYQLGNTFAMVAVDLPTHLVNSGLRLQQVKDCIGAIKCSHQPQATMAFLSIVGCLPKAWQNFALGLFTSKASVILTNLEGPKNQRYLAGSKMKEFVLLVPQTGEIGVGFSFISYAGKIQIGLSVDDQLVDHPERLLALTFDAFNQLATAASVAPIRWDEIEVDSHSIAQREPIYFDAEITA